MAWMHKLERGTQRGNVNCNCNLSGFRCLTMLSGPIGRSLIMWQQRGTHKTTTAHSIQCCCCCCCSYIRHRKQLSALCRVSRWADLAWEVRSFARCNNWCHNIFIDITWKYLPDHSIGILAIHLKLLQIFCKHFKMIYTNSLVYYNND